MLAIDWTWQRRLAGSHGLQLVATDLIVSQPRVLCTRSRRRSAHENGCQSRLRRRLSVHWPAIGCKAPYMKSDWLGIPVGHGGGEHLGCLLIGLLYAMFSGPYPVRDEIRIGLIVGVLGGFTTFSAFGLETFLIARRDLVGHPERGAELHLGAGRGVVRISRRGILFRPHRRGAPVTAQFGRVPDQMVFVPTTCRCGVGNRGGRGKACRARLCG